MVNHGTLLQCARVAKGCSEGKKAAGAGTYLASHAHAQDGRQQGGGSRAQHSTAREGTAQGLAYMGALNALVCGPSAVWLIVCSYTAPTYADGSLALSSSPGGMLPSGMSLVGHRVNRAHLAPNFVLMAPLAVPEATHTGSAAEGTSCASSQHLNPLLTGRCRPVGDPGEEEGVFVGPGAAEGARARSGGGRTHRLKQAAEPCGRLSEGHPSGLSRT